MVRRTPKNRTDREVAKAIALQLPDVELNSHHGTMDLRVRNKVFATFPAESKHAVLRCAPAALASAVQENPEIYSRARGDIWLQVDLEQIDRGTLRKLLINAWVEAAPPQLRSRYEAELDVRIR